VSLDHSGGFPITKKDYIKRLTYVGGPEEIVKEMDQPHDFGKNTFL
jgi:hypothetical protein